MVVVGGQSSGKSSLLERITGFFFPRGSQGLCTRYVTQITLRRHPSEMIVVSITPLSTASPATRLKFRDFHQLLLDTKPKTLERVIEEINAAIEIRSGNSKEDMSLPVFSNHILNIKISGPDNPHLTAIDVCFPVSRG
ncbi:hypothetical protein B0H66DRAFT_535220 [Apodospora peruviana]|uniref:Dynamin N-terminal domain-containing protein n=1 Tax=Apodospora peruviana TaxID=516989 RepID=A0AAE0M338_9PEZI|nr:hypothetical protein B0H66DRAFT_535220 [Apodospora peruviana]